MIEVITHAECVLRLSTNENYEKTVTDELMKLTGDITTDKILTISQPHRNTRNQTVETNVLATFTLYIPEEDSQKHVEEYVEDIVPFLKRHLPKCNEIATTKIIQMKRIRH